MPVTDYKDCSEIWRNIFKPSRSFAGSIIYKIAVRRNQHIIPVQLLLWKKWFFPVWPVQYALCAEPDLGSSDLLTITPLGLRCEHAGLQCIPWGKEKKVEGCLYNVWLILCFQHWLKYNSLNSLAINLWFYTPTVPVL